MKKLFLLLIISSFTLVTFPQTWVQMASAYDYGRRSTFGCSVNGKGYTGLGQIHSGLYVEDFWEYDTTSNKWSKKADYPGAGLYECTSFVINGKIYVGMGYSNSHSCQNDLWQYNPITNTWIQKASFPGIARYGARSFVIGDSAYVIGGSNGGSGQYLSDMFMYNAITDTWEEKASFAGGSRANGAAFSIMGFGYYGAGSSDSYTVNNDFWKYNPISNTWSIVPNFPGYPRNAPISFVINNMAYVGFGDAISVFFNDFCIFSPQTNSWQHYTAPSSVTERSGCFAFSIGNNGYIGGGKNNIGILTDTWRMNTTSIITNTSHSSRINSLITIFPNPTSNNVAVELLDETKSFPVNLIIYSADGKYIFEKTLLNKMTILDLNSLTKGLYFFNFKSLNIEETHRVILQ